MSGKGGRLTRRESDSQTLPGVVLDLYSQTVHPFLPLERERERNINVCMYVYVLF